VFSAPNYVDQSGNKGAFVSLSITYQNVEHVLKNYVIDSNRCCREQRVHTVRSISTPSDEAYGLHPGRIGKFDDVNSLKVYLALLLLLLVIIYVFLRSFIDLSAGDELRVLVPARLITSNFGRIPLKKRVPNMLS
jgi:hypothetical protein